MNLLNLFNHPKELIDLLPRDLERKLKENPACIVIDVRTKGEYQSGHIADAHLYPLGHEDQIARDFDPEQDIILICRSGHRSQAAATELFKRHKFRKLSHLKGGMESWKRSNLPYEHN